MVNHHSGDGYHELVPGIRIKTLVHGERTLMTEVLMKKGSVLPQHRHPHEQTGYLISGAVTFTIGDTVTRMRPGDSWCIPADLSHGADVSDDAVVLEIFSPVREEYLKFFDSSAINK